MPQIGPLELLVVSVIALVVLGPQRLPDVARSVGKALSQLRTMAEQVKNEFDASLLDTADEDVAPAALSRDSVGAADADQERAEASPVAS